MVFRVYHLDVEASATKWSQTHFERIGVKDDVKDPKLQWIGTNDKKRQKGVFVGGQTDRQSVGQSASGSEQMTISNIKQLIQG